MLSHKQIWGAIDALASRYGHSPSGLARAAGLDPTTFNKSKRLGPNGRLRWPSTESISKILQVTGASFEEFVAFVSRSSARHPSRILPLLKLKDAAKKKAFDSEGCPARKTWGRLSFPDLGDDGAFALEITGGKGSPMFADGAVIVVSPQAKLKRGDLVVVKFKSGCSVKRLSKRTAKKLELKALNGEGAAETLERGAVDWVARIVWVRH